MQNGVGEEEEKRKGARLESAFLEVLNRTLLPRRLALHALSVIGFLGRLGFNPEDKIVISYARAETDNVGLLTFWMR